MSGQITGLTQYEEAANKNRNWRDNLNLSIFGTDTESAIKGRQLKDGKIEANFWDRVVGNSTEELTNAAKKRRAEQIKTSQQGQYLLAEGKDIGVDSIDGTINKQYRDTQDLNKAISELQATGGYNGNIEALKNTDAAYVRGLIPGAKDSAYKQTTQYKDSKAAEVKRDQRYELEQDRLWADKQEGRRQTALQLQMNAENNRMTTQLEYARLSQQDRQNAQDRKDKAIMMLMQGLGNLGNCLYHLITGYKYSRLLRN